MTYNEFLEMFEIIDEWIFNEIMESLPDLDYESLVDVSSYFIEDISSTDTVCEIFITAGLQQFPGAYCDVVNFEQKTFELCDVDSEEDLEEIVKLFDQWKITNLELIRNQFKREKESQELEEKEHEIWDFLLDCENISYENLLTFAKQYGYKE